MAELKKKETQHPFLRSMDEDSHWFNLVCRAITFTDRIIAGGRENYEKVIEGQPFNDRLSMENFNRFNDFYYLFRASPEMRQLLDLFIILEGRAKMSSIRKALSNWTIMKTTRSDHANQLLTLIKNNIPEEISFLEKYQRATLEEAVIYGAYLEQVQHDAYATCEPISSNARYLLQAASISLFAASGVAGPFDGCAFFTESSASKIRTYLMKRHNPVMSAQIYALSHI